jgi:hypothetical protein
MAHAPPPSQRPAQGSMQRPPDGGVREMLVSILIPSLPNAAFSATVNAKSIRLLPNGAQITQVNHRKIARDKAGRIFQERRMLVPDDGAHESVITQIEISDPVKHELYICQPEEHVCQLEEFSPVEGNDASVIGKEPTGPGVEHLGKQTIEGIETSGIRQSVEIPAGKIGNDRVLVATREYWYAPRLGVNLVSTRDDPQYGKQEFRVTEIVLGEPNASLFEPPKDAKILDLRKPTEISPPGSSPN